MKKTLICLALLISFVALPAMAGKYDFLDDMSEEEREEYISNMSQEEAEDYLAEEWADANAAMAEASAGVVGFLGFGVGGGYEIGVPAHDAVLGEMYATYTYIGLDPHVGALTGNIEVLFPVYSIPLGEGMNLGFHAGGSTYLAFGMADRAGYPYDPDWYFGWGLLANIRGALYIGDETGSLFVGLDIGFGGQFAGNARNDANGLPLAINLVAGLGI